MPFLDCKFAHALIEGSEMRQQERYFDAWTDGVDAQHLYGGSVRGSVRDRGRSSQRGSEGPRQSEGQKQSEGQRQSEGQKQSEGQRQ